MYDEADHLDDELARLARLVQRGKATQAHLQLAEFALTLDRRIQFEERILTLARKELAGPAPGVLAAVQREHASLCGLVARVASALTRTDSPRALDAIDRLRSVLLLHVVKEATFEPLLHASA
ncbi:MAG: hypothetical protein K8M05_05880 [Deltaproteobacteria bacterium]|nr:hypothetical protein [Kofleriaceae bacterium]